MNPQRSFIVFVFACLGLALSTAWSAPPDPLSGGSVDEFGKYRPAAAEELATDSLTDPDQWLSKRLEEAAGLVEDLGDGRHRIGLVCFDSGTRSVTIPARVHARSGLVEYALVTEKGKVHEAMLTTKASAMDVHLAALLIGLADAKKDGQAQAVEVWLEWQGNGPMRKQRLEEWVALAEESPSGPVGGTLETGEWTYRGSVLDQQGFAASREGSLISLIGDLAALILNPRPGRVNDKLHVPNSKIMPPLGFPVSVVLRTAAPDEPVEDATKAAPP